MKKLLFVITIMGLLACSNNSETNELMLKKKISVKSIDGKMGCENCGMNLKKYIATSHAIKMKNKDSHYYCSINCSSISFEKLKDNVDSIYAIDYGETKYYPVEDMHYVIGANLKGTMTRLSKFSFSNLEKAESFKLTFSGKQIVNYTEALALSMTEITARKNMKK